MKPRHILTATQILEGRSCKKWQNAMVQALINLFRWRGGKILALETEEFFRERAKRADLKMCLK
ncbi:hypothetical protein [Nitrosomonas sp.]|uniref:hypothetical protein n=1 Tax=Nitrosomonas sp. TaxID=42353 RepID=UPI0028507172|nr:hypothetical protein [Nitrosomonas sp.]MDR4515700.1 hypothetical protein [Nitrosomonas sp.]